MDQQEANAVALKLPVFWPEEPEVWFSQAEAQFELRNITQDATKYHYVVASLDQATAKRLLDLLQNPPATNKYDAIRLRLLQTFCLDDSQRASRLLHMSGLGDDKPSVLMDNMLSLLGQHDPCFLFRQIFLEQMPDSIRSHLIRANIQDPRQLAVAADELWNSQQTSTANTVYKDKRQNWKPRPRSSATPTTSTGNLCFYHTHFGAKARQCRPPCDFQVQGNESADRR